MTIFDSLPWTCDAMINAMRLDATDVLEYFAKNIHLISEIGTLCLAKLKAESDKSFDQLNYFFLLLSAF